MASLGAGKSLGSNAVAPAMGGPHHVECERADTRKCPPQLSVVITVLRLRRGQVIPQRSHAVSALLRR